ncbi:MAG TPA: hypothetical protein ACFE0H_07335 [Elainellaceae cyanobacterium]
MRSPHTYESQQEGRSRLFASLGCGGILPIMNDEGDRNVGERREFLF